MILLQSQQHGFWTWFATEVFFAVFVALLLYFFIVKNPEINKYIKRKKPDETPNNKSD
jgi:cytosine/uracil/thiamine/allantoin permease